MNSIYSDIQSQPPHISPPQKSRPSPTGGFQAELGVQLAQNTQLASPAQQETKDSALIHLGRLSFQNPTVSHLLVTHSQTKTDCWSIVHDPVNQDKPFHQLMPGQNVWFNPKTKEVVLDPQTDDQKQEAESAANDMSHQIAESSSHTQGHTGTVKTHATPDRVQDHDRQIQPAPASFLAPAFSFTSPTLENREQQTLSTQALSQAVAVYRGQPYSSLNCYELVVQGLKDLGVQYSGQQGLQNALIQEAKANNLPLNALLTGEGLISSLGRPVTETHITPDASDIRQQANEVFTSLQDSLEPGMILSFSTKNRGHTGVISSTENSWTFINSGQIDNSIHAGEKGQQVGEEDLFQEVINWVQRAADEGSHLLVTSGRLDREKLAAYQPEAGRKA